METNDTPFDLPLTTPSFNFAATVKIMRQEMNDLVKKGNKEEINKFLEDRLIKQNLFRHDFINFVQKVFQLETDSPEQSQSSLFTATDRLNQEMVQALIDGFIMACNNFKEKQKSHNPRGDFENIPSDNLIILLGGHFHKDFNDNTDTLAMNAASAHETSDVGAKIIAIFIDAIVKTNQHNPAGVAQKVKTFIQQRDRDGYCNPLHLATRFGHIEVTRVLLDKMIEAHHGDKPKAFEDIKELLGEADKSPRLGWSPLMFAAHDARKDVVDILLSKIKELSENDQQSHLAIKELILQKSTPSDGKSPVRDSLDVARDYGLNNEDYGQAFYSYLTECVATMIKEDSRNNPAAGAGAAPAAGSQGSPPSATPARFAVGSRDDREDRETKRLRDGDGRNSPSAGAGAGGAGGATR